MPNLEKSENKEEHDIISAQPSYVFMNPIVDTILYVIILLLIYGIYLVASELPERLEKILALDSNIKFHTASSLLNSVMFFVVIKLFHSLFINQIENLILKYLNNKYKQECVEVLEIYKFKVGTNIYKFIFITIASIYGFFLLRELEFFNTNLGGEGSYDKFIKNGAPYIFQLNHIMSDIGFYYNAFLGFIYFEIFLLITQPLQSDFLLMVLHHLATVSLIIFSYLSNYTPIGSLILFLMYVGDVPSTLVRVVIYLNISETYSVISTIIFLITFAYTRIFVFPELIYLTITQEHKFGYLESYLSLFLILLLLLSILWIVMITKKLFTYLKTRKIEDIYKIKIIIKQRTQ